MFELNAGRIDVSKFQIGVIWELRVEDGGSFVGRPVKSPSEKSGWMRIIPIGVEYHRALDNARRPYLEKLRSGNLTNEEDAAITGLALSSLVKDWGNFTISGETIPYSPAKAAELLSTIEWSNLRGLVAAIAEDRSALLYEEEKASLGNSQGD